jgi:transcriptional regulator with XRE-family HTH domain
VDFVDFKIFLALPGNRMVTMQPTLHSLTVSTIHKIDGEVPWKGSSMKIGIMIRSFRLQRGMSQGDIEKRTGLLRCYLSRVENGHTVPSLDTLSKIAHALDVPLAQFFSEDSLGKELDAHRLTDDELRFLNQIRRYSTNLNDSDRKLLLAMVKKFAATATR